MARLPRAASGPSQDEASRASPAAMVLAALLLVLVCGSAASETDQASAAAFDFHPGIVHLTDANSMVRRPSAEGKEVWLLAFYNSAFVKSSSPTVSACCCRNRSAASCSLMHDEQSQHNLTAIVCAGEADGPPE